MEADKDLGSRQSCTSAVTGSFFFHSASSASMISIYFYGKLAYLIFVSHCELRKSSPPAEIIGEEPIVLSSQSTACPTVSETERPRPLSMILAKSLSKQAHRAETYENTVSSGCDCHVYNGSPSLELGVGQVFALLCLVLVEPIFSLIIQAWQAMLHCSLMQFFGYKQKTSKNPLKQCCSAEKMI